MIMIARTAARRWPRLLALISLAMLSWPIAAAEVVLFANVTSSVGEEACLNFRLLTSAAGDRVVELRGNTTSGTGSATIAVTGKSSLAADANAGVALCTITLSLGTAEISGECLIPAPWTRICGNVTAISGTGAVLNGVIQY